MGIQLWELLFEAFSGLLREFLDHILCALVGNALDFLFAGSSQEIDDDFYLVVGFSNEFLNFSIKSTLFAFEQRSSLDHFRENAADGP